MILTSKNPGHSKLYILLNADLNTLRTSCNCIIGKIWYNICLNCIWLINISFQNSKHHLLKYFGTYFKFFPSAQIVWKLFKFFCSSFQVLLATFQDSFLPQISNYSFNSENPRIKATKYTYKKNKLILKKWSSNFSILAILKTNKNGYLISPNVWRLLLPR